MTGKRIVLTARARDDVRQATAWYRNEGDSKLARHWLSALEDAMRHISEYPKTGATRYAVLLRLEELRFWQVTGFPYLIFYIEREHHIDVGRVLHAKRDIPALMSMPPGPA